jgi:hypothetical protein
MQDDDGIFSIYIFTTVMMNRYIYYYYYLSSTSILCFGMRSSMSSFDEIVWYFDLIFLLFFAQVIFSIGKEDKKEREE